MRPARLWLRDASSAKSWEPVRIHDPSKPGRILYEMEGVPEETAREALRLAAHKLSLRTRFVTRAEGA